MVKRPHYPSNYSWQTTWSGAEEWVAGPTLQSGNYTTLYQSSVYRHQTLGLGLKIYLSCRMNLNLEYAFHFAQYVDRNAFTSQINQQNT